MFDQWLIYLYGRHLAFRNWCYKRRTISVLCVLVIYLLALGYEYRILVPFNVLRDGVFICTVVLLYCCAWEIRVQQYVLEVERKKDILVAMVIVYFMFKDLIKTTNLVVKEVKFLDLCFVFSYFLYGINRLLIPPRPLQIEDDRDGLENLSTTLKLLIIFYEISQWISELDPLQYLDYLINWNPRRLVPFSFFARRKKKTSGKILIPDYDRVDYENREIGMMDAQMCYNYTNLPITHPNYKKQPPILFRKRPIIPELDGDKSDPYSPMDNILSYHRPAAGPYSLLRDKYRRTFVDTAFASQYNRSLDGTFSSYLGEPHRTSFDTSRCPYNSFYENGQLHTPETFTYPRPIDGRFSSLLDKPRKTSFITTSRSPYNSFYENRQIHNAETFAYPRPRDDGFSSFRDDCRRTLINTNPTFPYNSFYEDRERNNLEFATYNNPADDTFFPPGNKYRRTLVDADSTPTYGSFCDDRGESKQRDPEFLSSTKMEKHTPRSPLFRRSQWGMDPILPP